MMALQCGKGAASLFVQRKSDVDFFFFHLLFKHSLATLSCAGVTEKGGSSPCEINYGGAQPPDSKNFCSFGGEPRDFLIEQSSVSLIGAAVQFEGRRGGNDCQQVQTFFWSSVEKLEISTKFFSATSLKTSLLRFLHIHHCKNP